MKRKCAIATAAIIPGDVEFVEGQEAARRARADNGIRRRCFEPVVLDEEVYPQL